jgi:hypothetical protein
VVVESRISCSLTAFGGADDAVGNQALDIQAVCRQAANVRKAALV